LGQSAAASAPDANAMPKIFVEYVGMGDSDMRDYPCSTVERTDLVEAIWRHFGVSSTIAVAFDFSSLVVLEHLARLLEGPIAAPTIDGAFIFNGGLFIDGHRAQGNRLDFGRIFDVYSGQIPFVVGASDEDPFERQ
jgi:hypothetical protein